MVMSGRQRAFTLVELLMVIIIIGVLAGIMVVGADAMFGRSKATRCLNDRKIIEKEYMLAKLNTPQSTSDDILSALASSHDGHYESGKITGICVEDGNYVCTLSDSDSMIKISCDKHTYTAAAEVATVTVPHVSSTLSDALSTAITGSVFVEDNIRYIVYNVKSFKDYSASTGAQSFSELVKGGKGSGVVNLGDHKGMFEYGKTSPKRGDIFTYGGREYVCIHDNNGKHTPGNNNSAEFWFLLN